MSGEHIVTVSLDNYSASHSATKIPPPIKTSIIISPENPADASKYDHTLPTLYRDAQSQLHRTSKNLEAFFQQEFDVKRLNKIHKYLFLAGRQMPARPLHRQVMMDRKIVVTEQVDLHLTWNGSQIYLKPLPSFLLKHAAWTDYLCKNQDLYANAFGFLISYAWLVCSESDFSIAMAVGDRPALLPQGLKWTDWKAFVDEVLEGVDVTAPQGINQRYKHGELRLGRLNLIYRLYPRFKFQHFIRGYYNRYHQYNMFFRRNFTWIILVFAYVTIILNAMQVGLATNELRDDGAFHRASYGFAVFSIIVPVVAIGSIVLLFVILALDNLVATIKDLKSRQVKSQAPEAA